MRFLKGNPHGNLALPWHLHIQHAIHAAHSGLCLDDVTFKDFLLKNLFFSTQNRRRRINGFCCQVFFVFCVYSAVAAHQSWNPTVPARGNINLRN